MDLSKHPVAKRGYRQTGVGTTEVITTRIKKGQVAIIQGWKVDDHKDGVFVTVNAIEKDVEFTNKISDGAITIVDAADGPVQFCNDVNTAVEKGWAHKVVIVPPEWKVR
ncbi:MAG: hypothetical protein HY425_02545 [Candidatus Levybacteria bacterium]|nr:hypothetical protein [Candidatus Levybacteria bacterium]